VSVASAAPLTVVVTSTTTASPTISLLPFPSSSLVSSTAVSFDSPLKKYTVNAHQTPILSLFPTTVSTSVPTVTVYTSFPDPSGQPRKGLGADDYPPPFSTSQSSKSVNIQSTAVISTTIIAESVLSAPTTLAIPDTGNSSQSHHSKNPNKHGELTPMAEHLLVAAGAIGMLQGIKFCHSKSLHFTGAFIMVAAGIWFFARMRKIDLFAPLRNHRIERGGSRGWYGWRRKEPDYYSDPPPQYSGEFPSDEKTYPNQSSLEAFYTPKMTSSMATPASSAGVPARANSQRQELVRERLLENSAPFGMAPAVLQTPAPTMLGPPQQTFYNPGEPNSSLSRQGTQTTQVSVAHSGYNNAGTQQTFQTAEAYDPNQREVNHLSYLSSLSSGFGDGLIMPEPTVVGAGEPRQSYRNTRKFSWMPSQLGGTGPAGDRDTVYTTASIETAPRFRTIHSWVAQQSGRVERQVQSDKEVPSMPPIPQPHQSGSGLVHQRNPSEDPAFRHHPGDEINIGRGSRVPSSILDRKVDVNLR
jgi:hypothetical protein